MYDWAKTRPPDRTRRSLYDLLHHLITSGRPSMLLPSSNLDLQNPLAASDDVEALPQGLVPRRVLLNGRDLVFFYSAIHSQTTSPLYRRRGVQVETGVLFSRPDRPKYYRAEPP